MYLCNYVVIHLYLHTPILLYLETSRQRHRAESQNPRALGLIASYPQSLRSLGFQDLRISKSQGLTVSESESLRALGTQSLMPSESQNLRCLGCQSCRTPDLQNLIISESQNLRISGPGIPRALCSESLQVSGP